jgi:WD40 repeat protein
MSKALTDFSQNRYMTYPHCNGFCGGGRFLVLGQIENEATSLWVVDIVSREERFICRFLQSQSPSVPMWFDVAYAAARLVTVADNAVWVYDLEGKDDPLCIYKAAGDDILGGMPSISSDGRRVLAGGRDADSYFGVIIHVESREVVKPIRHSWWANHIHFCPHDENWIGYCHEGKAEDVSDRVWAWHADEAPEGKCIFNQESQTPGVHLCVGHERWCFHDNAVLVPAYAISAAGPYGLYQIFPDARPPRFVSEGNRDWHCDISRDGKWAVVDTSGPHDLPGKSWENSGGISDVLLINVATGVRRFLARSRMTNPHPSHPHPVFSPDGCRVFYNEANEQGTQNRIMEVVL